MKTKVSGNLGESTNRNRVGSSASSGGGGGGSGVDNGADAAANTSLTTVDAVASSVRALRDKVRNLLCCISVHIPAHIPVFGRAVAFRRL